MKIIPDLLHTCHAVVISIIFLMFNSAKISAFYVLLLYWHYCCVDVLALYSKQHKEDNFYVVFYLINKVCVKDNPEWTEL